jgi:methylglutamate dehydrogenase subunit D
VPDIVLDARSPLEGARPFKGETLRIIEAQDYSLTQVAGFGKAFEKSLTAIAGKLPTKVGVASSNSGLTTMRIAPQQFWIVGGAGERLSLPADCLVTPLTSSRFRIGLDGASARQTLSKCCAIDFHASVFKPGQFVMTGIHHMPVFMHCTATDAFHLYVMRTFALHMWEILTDAAHS